MKKTAMLMVICGCVGLIGAFASRQGREFVF